MKNLLNLLAIYHLLSTAQLCLFAIVATHESASPEHPCKACLYRCPSDSLGFAAAEMKFKKARKQ